MIDPWHDDGQARFHLGEAGAILSQLPDQSVHCIVTSPPYFGLRDYGTAVWKGGAADCDHRGAPMQSQRSTLRGNGHGGEKPLSPSLQAQAQPFGAVCGKCGAERDDEQLGLERTPAEYVERFVGIMREAKRVLRKDGTCWLNIGDSYATRWASVHNAGRGGLDKAAPRFRHGANETGVKDKELLGIPWRVAFGLQDDGWYLRAEIIWAKTNPKPESVKDRPTQSHEQLFLLSRSRRYYYDGAAIAERVSGTAHGRGGRDVPAGWTRNDLANDGAALGVRTAVANEGAAPLDVPEFRNKRSVWTVAPSPFNEAHFATFPPALVTPCILAGCPEGGLVLDPFLGSGTTAMVAKSLGRRAIGIDIKAEYLEMARRRCAQMGLGFNGG